MFTDIAIEMRLCMSVCILALNRIAALTHTHVHGHKWWPVSQSTGPVIDIDSFQSPDKTYHKLGTKQSAQIILLQRISDRKDKKKRRRSALDNDRNSGLWGKLCNCIAKVSNATETAFQKPNAVQMSMNERRLSCPTADSVEL